MAALMGRLFVATSVALSSWVRPLGDIRMLLAIFKRVFPVLVTASSTSSGVNSSGCNTFSSARPEQEPKKTTPHYQLSTTQFGTDLQVAPVDREGPKRRRERKEKEKGKGKGGREGKWVKNI